MIRYEICDRCLSNSFPGEEGEQCVWAMGGCHSVDDGLFSLLLFIKSNRNQWKHLLLVGVRTIDILVLVTDVLYSKSSRL